MSSFNIPQKTLRISVPENIDLDPCDIACTLIMIAGLASRCLESGDSTVNDDLIWSIVKLSERLAREISSIRVVS